MTICKVCNMDKPSAFRLNVLDKGIIWICPECNKKRANAENKAIDSFGKHPEQYNKLLFEKEYFKNKVK